MRLVFVWLAAACALGIAASPPALALAQAPWEPLPPVELAPLASPALLGLATSGDRSRIRKSGALGWVLVLGGAVAGGALGFAMAAPECLDGSTGCGSRPLVYIAVGSAVGAAVGWIVRSATGSR